MQHFRDPRPARNGACACLRYPHCGRIRDHVLGICPHRLTGDYGIAWLLTRLVGTPRAWELMVQSERIDARRCETLGLVNRLVPDLELREATFALARS